MVYEGKLNRVLPIISGTSQKGNEWKKLPFVFEYFEADNQQNSAKVYIETMDHDIMRAIGQFVERGADGKGIVENGCMKLKCEVKCKVGFSLRIREYEGKIYNQIWCYLFEALPAANAAGTAAQPQQPYQVQQTQQPLFPPQQQPQQEESDDLPF